MILFKEKHKILCEENQLESEPGNIFTSVQRQSLKRNLTQNLRREHRLRIEIMLLADLGHSHSAISWKLGCSDETVKYWISMAINGQADQWKEISIGRPKKVSDEYLSRLKQLVNQNPRECGYSFNRWTAKWLSKHLANEFGIEISERHINRLLKKMKLSTNSQLCGEGKVNTLRKPDDFAIVINNLSTSMKSNPLYIKLF